MSPSRVAPGPTGTALVDRAVIHETNLFENAHETTPGAVAKTGYDAFRDGRTLIVPGWPNKTSAVLIRVTPRSVAHRGAGWLNS